MPVSDPCGALSPVSRSDLNRTASGRDLHDRQRPTSESGEARQRPLLRLFSCALTMSCQSLHRWTSDTVVALQT
jgi:hypothetical protein